MKTPIQVRAAAGGAEVLIYEQIGSSLLEEGMTAKRFAEQLKSLGSVRNINVRINSPGGSVFEGLAIYNTLRSHPARVTVDIDGAALSMAATIAMAGDTIRMANNGYLMIHDPMMTVRSANYAELAKAADLAASMRDQLANIYASRTRLPRAEILSMMAAETWLTATEAKAKGFVDAVTGELAIAAHFDGRFVAKGIPARFKAKADPLANTKTWFDVVRLYQRDGMTRPAAIAEAHKVWPELRALMHSEARANPRAYNRLVVELQKG